MDILHNIRAAQVVGRGGHAKAVVADLNGEDVVEEGEDDKGGLPRDRGVSQRAPGDSSGEVVLDFGVGEERGDSV